MCMIVCKLMLCDCGANTVLIKAHLHQGPPGTNESQSRLVTCVHHSPFALSEVSVIACRCSTAPVATAESVMESVLEVAHKAIAISGKARLHLWTSTLARPSRSAGTMHARHASGLMIACRNVQEWRRSEDMRMHSQYAGACCIAEFLEANAEELVGIVFATLPVYRDSVSRRAVVGFLREAVAASDAFLKTFAAALIRCDPAKRSNQVHRQFDEHITSAYQLIYKWVCHPLICTMSTDSPCCTQECIVLLSWNDLLLQQLRLPAAAKAAARIVISQVGLLDSLLGHPKWPRIARLAGAVLRDKPALLDDYVGVARSGEVFAMEQPRRIKMLGLAEGCLPPRRAVQLPMLQQHAATQNCSTDCYRLACRGQLGAVAPRKQP